ncbi:MAG: NAD(+) synthase [Christensenellales bacterium]|jgi:NAD+ synthase (glutamine-hydrolysing)
MDNLRVMASSLAGGRPGDVAANARAALARVEEARAAGAELLVLPELCLCGVSCGDLLGQPLLLDACREAALKIAQASMGLAVVVGLPVALGQGVYNAALLAYDGAVQGLVLKQKLSWREHRVFAPGNEAGVSEGWHCPVYAGEEGHFTLPGGQRLHLCFMEDKTKTSSSGALALMGALPARAGGGYTRMKVINDKAAGGLCAWANAGIYESTTDQVYDGQALVIMGGRMLGETAQIDLSSIPWQPDPTMPYAPGEDAARAVWCREALEIVAHGLARRMVRIGAKGASLGLSGGLDSAMALLVALRAFEISGLDKQNLFAVSLPAFGTSRRTRSNARALLAACGLPEREIDITASVARHLKDIGHLEGRQDAVFENAQARERTQVLMDMANQIGGLMIGPGDMSELALGFTTYGGDHMSMYGVNAGLYKTAIRLIVAQAARDADNTALARVLNDILDTPISPELIPGEDGGIRQKTEDILGPYVLNDFFLHHFLTDRLSPLQLLAKARAAFKDVYAHQEILSCMRSFFGRFFASQFKRSCLPDGPQVLGLSLSPRGGLDMPSDASAALWISAIDTLINQDKGE